MLAKEHGGLEYIYPDKEDSVWGSPKQSYEALSKGGNSNLNLVENGGWSPEKTKPEYVGMLGYYWSDTPYKEAKSDSVYVLVLEDRANSITIDVMPKDLRLSCRCVRKKQD